MRIIYPWSNFFHTTNIWIHENVLEHIHLFGHLSARREAFDLDDALPHAEKADEDEENTGHEGEDDEGVGVVHLFLGDGDSFFAGARDGTNGHAKGLAVLIGDVRQVVGRWRDGDIHRRVDDE